MTPAARKCAPFAQARGQLQFDERETGDFLEVALIPGCHRVPSLQGTRPDQQIVEGDGYAFGRR